MRAKPLTAILTLADYERFCSVYPNAALILEQWLDIEQVAPMISAICNDKD